MATDKHQLSRLHWRCRRGTRELDRLMSGWLTQHGATASAASIGAFEDLLDMQDPELMALIISGQKAPSDTALDGATRAQRIECADDHTECETATRHEASEREKILEQIREI